MLFRGSTRWGRPALRCGVSTARLPSFGQRAHTRESAWLPSRQLFELLRRRPRDARRVAPASHHPIALGVTTESSVNAGRIHTSVAEEEHSPVVLVEPNGKMLPWFNPPHNLRVMLTMADKEYSGTWWKFPPLRNAILAGVLAASLSFSSAPGYYARLCDRGLRCGDPAWWLALDSRRGRETRARTRDRHRGADGLRHCRCRRARTVGRGCRTRRALRRCQRIEEQRSPALDRRSAHCSTSRQRRRAYSATAPSKPCWRISSSPATRSWCGPARASLPTAS